MRTTPAKTKSPTWPYIAMVACLFIGSILATQTYRRPDPMPLSFELEGPGEDEPDAENGEPVLQVPKVQPFTAATKVEPPVEPLGGFDAPSVIARVAPPVADRVPVDVVLEAAEARKDSAETPAAITPPTALIARRVRDIPLENKSPILRRQSLVEPRQEDYCWPFPRALAEQVEAVSRFSDAARWSEQCLIAINQLTQVNSHHSLDAARQLDQIKRLAGEARAIASTTRDKRCRIELLRAAYAIQRREDIWRNVHRLASGAAVRRTVTDGEHDMHGVINGVRKWLVERQSQEWANFLGLDKAESIARSSASTSADMQQHARIILTRFTLPTLNAPQREFLTSAPVAAYQLRLRHWAAEPFNYIRLLNELEEFELLPGEKQGEIVAKRIAEMQWSDREGERKMAERLAIYYRNANFRITLSNNFVNRLLPAPESIHEDVNDYVVGAHVVGRSETSADLKIKLQPSPRRWQLTLEASGFVASETSSRKGPVTTFQDGLSEYLVRKHLVVDPKLGVLDSPSEAFAASESDLVGLRTDFDGVPLLNLIARSVALQQYDSSAGEARYEVDNKVASRAQERVDSEIKDRLAEIEARLKTAVLGPLGELRLDPKITDMQTAEDALIARFRLAGKDQVSAFTPRPREPKGSMISVQMHESAMNNAIEGLQLAGQRMELVELFRKISRLADAANQPVPIPEELPADVFVTFVDHDPIRVRFRDGQLHLSIDVKALEAEDRKWGRFGVDIYYKPTDDQVDANLVRDGVIEVRGHMSFRDRIPLRAVFGKVFTKNRQITLLNDHLRQSARLQGLHVSQFVLRDGWLGLAIAQNETAAAESSQEVRR